MEKHVILDVLKKSIHNILLTFEDLVPAIVDDSHITQSLCSSIEAMFLHGEISSQSNNIFNKFRRVKLPYEYDFRSFIIEFIPRNLLQILENHEFKLTSIGFCRIWLRYTLNESTILSYLESMIKDEKRLKRFYSKDALLRDEELMDTFCGLLKSIEHLTFHLDTSLPLLNTWVNSDALKIAGLQLHASSSGDVNHVERNQSNENVVPDVPNTGEEEILPTDLMSIRSHISVQHAVNKNPNLNDDVNININNSIESDPTEQEISANDIYSDPEKQLQKEVVNYTEATENMTIAVENDLEVNAVESNTVNFEQCVLDVHFIDSLKSIQNGDDNILSVESNHQINDKYVDVISTTHKNNTQDSFDQLWTQCNITTELPIIPIEEVHIENIEISQEPNIEIIFDNNDISDNVEPSKDLKKLMDIFPGANESSSRSGENSVFGGQCHKCHSSLETNKVFFDYYDGQLYCFSCEAKTKAIIPRDVIYNWDFTPKSVSRSTKQFLSEIMVHPNINLATNSCLFDVVPELSRVRKLRHKLSLLWLQVTSCDIETSTKVREAMFPREYMLASVKEKDLYSLEDLIMLHSGVLEKTLLYVIEKIAISHVNKCLVCRMKALACDKCRDKNNLIYIHEIDYYCECSTPLCQSVIHNGCKKPETKSFYCRRCVQYLESQQPITLASYDTADTND